MKTKESLERFFEAEKILLRIGQRCYDSYLHDDGGSDFDHSCADILLGIEDLLKLYGLKPTNMPCYGNFLDKDGGL